MLNSATQISVTQRGVGQSARRKSKDFVSDIIVKDKSRRCVSVPLAMINVHIRCDLDSILAVFFENFHLAFIIGRSNHCSVTFAACKGVDFGPSIAGVESIGVSMRCSSREFTPLGGEIKQAADPGKEAEEGTEGRNASANNEAAHFDRRPI